MSEDYAVWDIDQILEAYSQEPELRDGVEAGLTALLVFLEKHQLLTCRVTDAQGKLFKRALMASEISGEGKLLTHGRNNPVQRWLGSKGGQKNPPDMKLLEKALATLRKAQ
ncbi:hypothetical protein HFV04_020210 [Pseudomonas sp. BIGb0427]|uniref:hypothetical protein n=1 Tax=unclassified Pseudomonas TaxID=196821 RepID=UPI0018A77B34|nr:MULTISPECIES: hypothetical protein [unclassified Pseudomonas]QPG61836.1 hypothetical protein HFV04_020210 [Pseudomonas sp. BIGb0427]UVM69349.1 hypothetical protein LOY34_12705 [Pseudomonas sp. B21-009]